MSNQNEQPIIVGFVADIMFSTRIAATAAKTGFQMKWIEQASDVGSAAPSNVRENPGEQILGQNGQLFEIITRWQPALLLFDLTNSAVPWQHWIPILKSSPATRRIPIMTFGPHADVALMTEARRVGADLVLARSRFVADMGALFQQHAILPDYAALHDTCAQPLPLLAQEGIALFNEGQFYACHDSLEEAWRQDEGLGRDLYRGILQIGIAYYQIERENYRGAIKMLLRVRQWLDPLPDICRGIHVADLRSDAATVYDTLTALGPDQISQFDRDLFRPIQLDG